MIRIVLQTRLFFERKKKTKKDKFNFAELKFYLRSFISFISLDWRD